MNMQNIFLSFLIIYAADTVRADQTAVSQLSESFFSTIGYRVLESAVKEPTEWEKEQFNLLTKSYARIKAKQQIDWKKEKFAGPGWYYRYEVTIEKYPSSEAAKARLPRMREAPPEIPVKFLKAHPLRRGVVIDDEVIIVSTDVNAFKLSGELDRVLQEIEKELRAE